MKQIKTKQIIVNLIILTLMAGMCIGTTSAWVSDYDYRMTITVNNVAGVTLTDYQFNFTNDTNVLVAMGHMQADGADCRITDSSDNPIPFWNETAFNAVGTKIWANGTLTVGDNTFYMYYGNTGASDASDISTTFDFGDSFSIDGGSLTRVDEPTNPTRIPDQTWEGGVLCEHSDFNYGGEYISWYRGHGSGTYETGFENSTDGVTWTAHPGNPILSHPTVYDYVVQDGDCFYLFVNTDPGANGNGDMYLYNVTDYTNPVIMNGGNAVYTRSPTNTDWDYKIFNPGIAIDGDGTWHMLLEGQSNAGVFRIGYAYSNLTEMNWSLHRSSSYVIDTAGNPDLVYVPDRNALLSIHGDISGTYWKLIASYANLSTDLTASANWTVAPNFELAHAGIHTADPMLMYNFNATYPIMISYNYNQAQTYQCYYAATLNEFYDAIRTSPFDKWDTYGIFSYGIDNGILTVSTTGNDWGIFVGKTAVSMPHIIEARSKALDVSDRARFGFSTDVGTTATNQVQWWWAHGTGNPYVASYVGGGGGYTLLSEALNHVNYHTYRVDWISASLAKFYYDDTYKLSRTSGIPTAALPAWMLSGTDVDGDILWDWIFIRKYTATEPTSSLGEEEDAPINGEHIPPAPVDLLNTTGNFWIHHTWGTGYGNITDSFRIKVNDTWYNSTNSYHHNDGLTAHAWSNITVYAWNSSGAGSISSGYVSENTQIPNNPVSITNLSNKNVDIGENIYIDGNAIDNDADIVTYSCNRTDLFSDFCTIYGTGNWTPLVNGTYHVDFGVSDGYGSTDNYTMSIYVGCSPPGGPGAFGSIVELIRDIIPTMVALKDIVIIVGTILVVLIVVIGLKDMFGDFITGFGEFFKKK